MTLRTMLLRLMVLISLYLTGNVAMATPPFGCIPGNQDNTCLTAIRHDPIPPNLCPTAAGWTTVVASVWQGFQWSQPECNLQPPPSCQAGQVQTAAPVWNGAQWVGLGCAPPLPPPSQNPDPKQMDQACRSLIAATTDFSVFQFSPETQLVILDTPNAHQVEFRYQPVSGPLVVASNSWMIVCTFLNGSTVPSPNLGAFPLDPNSDGGG
ncbi:hypothetical protein BX592_111209 [Paraburkholderia rhizosphaerae]|uniref:Uncharacterized protein n=1 Tax=Paraburkholderia rhizosphaerae TaxID=480658 RepID=A0A4R8LS91_9BURK|nr:hypothetical protein BX592_111209 [Paraburkholderia rhizosphaerae]